MQFPGPNSSFWKEESQPFNKQMTKRPWSQNWPTELCAQSDWFTSYNRKQDKVNKLKAAVIDRVLRDRLFSKCWHQLFVFLVSRHYWTNTHYFSIRCYGVNYWHFHSQVFVQMNMIQMLFVTQELYFEIVSCRCWQHSKSTTTFSHICISFSNKTNITLTFSFQNEEIQKGPLKTPGLFLMRRHWGSEPSQYITCNTRSSGMLNSTYIGCHAAAFWIDQICNPSPWTHPPSPLPPSPFIEIIEVINSKWKYTCECVFF